MRSLEQEPSQRAAEKPARQPTDESLGEHQLEDLRTAKTDNFQNRYFPRAVPYAHRQAVTDAERHETQGAVAKQGDEFDKPGEAGYRRIEKGSFGRGSCRRGGAAQLPVDGRGHGVALLRVRETHAVKRHLAGLVRCDLQVGEIHQDRALQPLGGRTKNSADGEGETAQTFQGNRLADFPTVARSCTLPDDGGAALGRKSREVRIGNLDVAELAHHIRFDSVHRHKVCHTRARADNKQLRRHALHPVHVFERGAMCLGKLRQRWAALEAVENDQHIRTRRCRQHPLQTPIDRDDRAEERNRQRDSHHGKGGSQGRPQQRVPRVAKPLHEASPRFS